MHDLPFSGELSSIPQDCTKMMQPIPFLPLPYLGMLNLPYSRFQLHTTVDATI